MASAILTAAMRRAGYKQAGLSRKGKPQFINPEGRAVDAVKAKAQFGKASTRRGRKMAKVRHGKRASDIIETQNAYAEIRRRLGAATQSERPDLIKSMKKLEAELKRLRRRQTKGF